MAWIKVVDEHEAIGSLKDIYADLVQRRGKVANIMKVQSLDPHSIEAHLGLYLHLLFGSHTLSRREKEMLAVAVSAANGCRYCVLHHSEALVHYEKDDGIRLALGTDYRTAQVSAWERVMLDYAVKLTHTPAEMTEGDVQSLRYNDFTDEQILHIALIAAYFNFVNRMALGLGVEFTPEEVVGYVT